MSFSEQYRDYVKNTPEGLWFRRKVFGWGWTPTTWQSWLVIAGYLFSVLAFLFTIDATSPPREIMFTFGLPVIFLTITLILVCYRKGERPRWQWGFPKDEN